MASPFAVFRRNQKVLTVVLTCLAMFAFIILDSVSKMETSAIMPILFGLLGASLAWMWGSQNERGVSYKVIGAGAIVGAIVGVIFINQLANQGGLATAHGRLTNRDLFEMKQKRDMANQFIISAFQERSEEIPPWIANYYLNQYRFGDTSSRSVVTKMLLEKEADSLGIEISNEFITDYIKTVSDNNMTREALTKIRGQLGMGESELYDTLRSELRARVASRVLNPELVHMPDQYWGDFEKLNVTQSIDAVAIPVKPFAARLSRPSESEIKEIFEAFKGVYPMGENPGFVQPDRLKIAWFEFDYESAEALVGEIPEDELKARYEERKETEYKKNEMLPEDFGAGFDDGAPKFGEPPIPVKSTTPETEGDAPGEAAKSNEPEAAPAAKTDDDAPAETPAGDDESRIKDATATDEKPDDASATETKSEECGDGDEQDQKADAETEETNARNDEQPETSEETPVADPKPAADSKTDEGTKPAVEETPAEPVDSPKDTAEEPVDVDLAGVKYHPFEEVRDEIRDLMLEKKTEEQIEKQVTLAITTVKDWRFKLREKNPEISDEELAAEIAVKAKAYAEENGLKFVATEFLSQQELIEHAEYQLGNAFEPSDPDDFMAQSQTAAARLFTGATTLFIPEEALSTSDESSDTRFAFWATDEKEQHVPTLDEPGVREQVEEAVRIRNARSETEARAQELAESLNKKFKESSIVTMAEGVAGQSIFGEDPPTGSDSSTEPEATEGENGSSDDSAKKNPAATRKEKNQHPQRPTQRSRNPLLMRPLTKNQLTTKSGTIHCR